MTKLNLFPQFGSKASGERLTRMVNSQNYWEGQFHNLVNTPMMTPGISRTKVLKEFIFRSQNGRIPQAPLPIQKVSKEWLQKPQINKTVITWLGHSSMLIQIQGLTIIIDPVFSKRASPFFFAGPKRFNHNLPLKEEDIEKVDAIILSHDHFDHLDYKTILKLHPKTGKFFMPLGVGAHLEGWGVPKKKIIELDWWEEIPLSENIQLAATPTRHFSGRRISNRFSTLWCSWVIKNPNHTLYFGGDSGYSPSFKTIGQRFGPFDLTMLESGAYSPYWPNIHMQPEQTVQAHLDLKGKLLLPIHWAQFNLSLHGWNEPIERLLSRAQRENVEVATPLIGEHLVLGNAPPQNRWWKKQE